MSLFLRIIDFFLPLMPSDSRSDEIAKIDPNTIIGNAHVLSKKVELAKQNYLEERERARTIEGKASMLITSTGFLGTVLIGTSNILLGQVGDESLFKLMMIICLLFFVIYMVGTILSSLKALQRTPYCRPEPISVMHMDVEMSIYLQTIIELVNSTYYNQNVTNHKMDYVVRAQRYFKRLILTVLAFVIVLLIYVLEQNGVSLGEGVSKFVKEISMWSFQCWYVLATIILVSVSLVMSFKALVKTQHVKKS